MMRKLEPQLNNEFNNDLFGVMSMINEPGEMASFLRDILTIDEIEEISKRLRVAKLLRKKVTVREIAKRTRMSSATISRINYWLHHGMGGYEIALEKLK
jgi:TrpR-related protein YerC/YecD